MSNASNAVLALCRAYYGKRLTKEKFDALISCDSVSELIASLREEAYYASFLEIVAPEAFAVEDAIRRSLFSRYGSICRFEKAIGSRFFELFIVRAEIDELLRFILLLSGGQSGDYIIGLSPELSKRTDIDLFALAGLKSFGELSAFLAGSRYEKVIASCLAFEKPSYLVFETAFERYYDEFLKELIRK